MGIDQIQANCEQLNRASKKAPKPKAKAPAQKANGHTVLTSDEMLRIDAARIVAAFKMESHGITTEHLVNGVKEYEAPYQGVVQ